VSTNMEEELLIPSRAEGMSDDVHTKETVGLKPEAAKAANVPDSPPVDIGPQLHVVVVEMVDKPWRRVRLEQ
jgi:hypothetical protein